MPFALVGIVGFGIVHAGLPLLAFLAKVFAGVVMLGRCIIFLVDYQKSSRSRRRTPALKVLKTSQKERD